MSYRVTHIGDGVFQATLDTGEIKEVGSNIIGMIRYTYFEDFKLPPINWEVTRKQLLDDYLPKVLKDVVDGLS
jgi:hypothetical protein